MAIAEHVRVLIIDEEPIRASIIEEGLRTGGDCLIERISDMHNLEARVTAIDPDVILIALENPSRDALEQVLRVSRSGTRAVGMFVDQSDPEMTRAAIEAGVSAYVVNGLHKERVRTIADMAIHRFQAFRRLRRELDEARTELVERKLIERAKGLLMKARGIGEEEAYRLMRRKAMNQNQRIVEVAQSLVTAADLLGGGL
ncbi:MAG: ANTAR domain-containing response regulator [Alphaproteobacteria bacterium]